MSRYTSYYWPIPFRACFIHVVFAHRDLDYSDASTDEVIELKNREIHDQPTPLMAPPALYDAERDRYYAQTSAIMFHLAQEHQLFPSDPALMPTVLKIIGDSMDVLAGITRNNGSQMWDVEAWERFTQTRLPRWLHIFEETGTRLGLTADAGFMLGTESATLSDLNVFALWATMERCLPELSTLLRANAPCVMALCDRLGASEALSALSENQRARYGQRYCGGQIEASIRSMLSRGAE